MIKEFLKDLYLSTIKPGLFFSKLYPKKNVKDGAIFYLVCLILSQVTAYFYLSLSSRSFIVPFVAINQFLFTLFPILAINLGLVSLLHLISKLLKGQGRWHQSLIAFSYSNGPLILASLPYPYGLPFRIYQLYLLVIAFKAAHKYPLTQALVTVILPTLAFLIILTLLTQGSGVS